MGEIKKLERRHQSPWIMEVEVSNQPRRKVIAENYGDLKNNISISPKLARQTRTWQDVMNQGTQATLADCKAKTYEYGDALISRDVVCDEFKERKKEDEKHQTEKHQPQQEKIQQEKNILKKKESVSVSSELPVAKSKWGVKLRHVITRESSIDDKTEVEQPIYNFRKAKPRPRSALYEESPKSSEEVNQLWRSKSNELILDSRNKGDRDKLEFMSVFQRMKSFELKTNKPGQGKTVENGTFTKEGTKPLSLEDLLNLDKQVLSVNVIDRGKVGNSKSNNINNGCTTTVDHDSNEQYSESKTIVPNGTNSKKDLCNIKKESLINVSPKDSENYSTKVLDNSISKKTVSIISPKKPSIFGKIRSKHPKKAISLEELLKLDEKNLSVDVVEKSKCRELELKGLDYKTDTEFKSEKAMLNANLSNAECGQHLNNSEKDNSDFYKEIFDYSGSNEMDLRTMETTEQPVDLALHPEIGIDKVVSAKYVETKPIESKYPGSPGLNVKEKRLNEKLAIDVTKNDPNIKYNKLGQIILNNDTILEPELGKAVSEPETFTSNDTIISNGDINHADWKTDHNMTDSDMKYIKLGQINDKLENGLIETKSKTGITMSHENINKKNIELLNGVGNSELIDQSDRKSDNHRQLSLKKTKEIHEINKNQNINGVNNVDPPEIYPSVDPKMSFGNHDGLLTHNSKEFTEVKKDKINHFDESEVDIVDNFKAKKQLNGISVDTGKTNLEEIDSISSKLSVKSQIYSNAHETKKSDLNCNQNKNKPDNQGYDQKLKNDTNISTKQEKPTKILSETKIPDQNGVDHQSESISRPPINRKVGKLIIMTGEQRNEQLKNKGKPPLNKSSPKHVNGKMDSTNIEDLKKLHKEGFSLTFMSNELEDDGVPDDYPIPRVVFNEKVVGLKSMIHTQKNKAVKHVMFNSTKLATIHTYPAEETYFEDSDDIGKTKVDEINSEQSSSNEFYPNMKTYEPNYSFDFGSVIQRERQRFNSMDEENVNPPTKHESTFDYNTDGDHFNSHHNQDAGHALLF